MWAGIELGLTLGPDLSMLWIAARASDARSAATFRYAMTAFASDAAEGESGPV
jgi:hypothetical protein